MVVEINGKSLSNNFDVFTYYEEITGSDLMSDMAMRSKKLSYIKGEQTSDEDMIKKFKLVEFSANLYHAARSAFENRLIPIKNIKDELSANVVFSEEFANKLFSLLDSKKKS